MKLRIIVIDDEKSIRYTFSEFLTSLGHEVINSEHPLAEFVCKKTQCTCEVACADGFFVDLSMPHMTGIQFLESLFRRGCKSPPANRFLMSGNLTKEAFDKASELGVTVVHKPVKLSKIAELVEEMQNNIDPHRRLADLHESP